jgi:hypothetical protein
MREKSASYALASCLTFLLLGFLAPLFAANAYAQTEIPEDQLRTQLGRLYLNYKNLDRVYRSLHDVALDAVAGSDQQLSYIQKTYLFVSEANLVCFYQWELLSITGYIKEDHQSDFFTLRVKDLDRAVFESKDRVNSLKLYYGFIQDETALKLIDEAIGLIEADIYIYETLMNLLRPLANPPNPFNQDT